MARIDKYEPYAGGFRANLAVDWLAADIEKAVGVGLNANGLIVKGVGTTGIVGVLVLGSEKGKKAGAVVDTMTDGEIIEFGGDPGSVYFSNAAGVISKAPSGVIPAGGVYVGHTVEAHRLITRVRPGAAA